MRLGVCSIAAELDGHVDGDRVWIACDCEADLAYPVSEPPKRDQPRARR